MSSKADEWSKLPPALREKMTQIYGSDIPVLWQSRIKAYILSVNAEEVRDQK
jgi:hypothetical protein